MTLDTQHQGGRHEAFSSHGKAVALDHITLRTDNLEATRDFLETLLDLKPGFRPGFPFPGYWLYAGEEPLVHLIPAQGGAVDRCGEAIDHAGFRVADHRAHVDKLDRMNVSYSRMELPELGERRLFVQTPGGILLELVFRDGPAAGFASSSAPTSRSAQ